jgi:prephenate dehydrogenase
VTHSHRNQRIAIVGLGVIGGSLGLAIKRNNPKATVIGFDTPAVLRRARKRKAIDVVASSIRIAVSDADIVFICTPVDTILRLLPAISRFIGPQTIVTDVGSVKGVVQSCAKKYFTSGGVFVGGHPMAGSEGSGIEYADPLLFQNAVYVLCPLRKGEKNILSLIALLKKIGARILLMDAREHDRIAAAISHLPQIVAVSLMNLASNKNKRNPAFLQLAAGGFRDMTRIASSPFPMWNEILSNNRSDVRQVLEEFGKELRQFEKGLTKESLSSIREKFLRAKSFRDSIPRNSKGFLHPTHDIYLWIDDKPGVLAQITSALFNKNINISDIELVKIREGEGGTFRLSFEMHETAQKAIAVLRRMKIRVQ